MYPIVDSKKVAEGITVFWDENKQLKYATFNFQDLIDLKINSLDLMNKPAAYQIDPPAHRILPKK